MRRHVAVMGQATSGVGGRVRVRWRWSHADLKDGREDGFENHRAIFGGEGGEVCDKHRGNLWRELERDGDAKLDAGEVRGMVVVAWQPGPPCEETTPYVHGQGKEGTEEATEDLDRLCAAGARADAYLSARASAPALATHADARDRRGA